LSGPVLLPTVRGLKAAALTAAALAGVLVLAGCEAESADPAPDDAGAETVEADADVGTSQPTKRPARVDRVVDGDTIELRNGRRVRLVQIDAPEASGECFGAEAGAMLGSILPPGTRVTLEGDPALDDVDRFGRLLRYVRKGRANVNLQLVKRGAASVWFFDGDRGRYADRLLEAARSARDRERGAWGACRAKLDPTRAFETAERSAGQARGLVGGGGGSCAPGYSPCLPVVGDLDCADVRALGKAPVSVTGSDPYRLDGGGDGIGCE
jgi:endonuclease YncB( thermonuclease family)